MPGTALHRPRGALAVGQMAVDLTAEGAGWAWSSLGVVELGPGGTHRIDTTGTEVVVLPLAGRCSVEVCGETIHLQGRDSPFSGLSDAAYVPCGTTASLATEGGGRFALPGARAQRRLEPAYLDRGSVPVELRGTGACSRRVANICFPGALDAERLLVCEVLTPGGNWSSYPPHKHDECSDGESELEEIYYFEVAQAGPGAPGSPCDPIAFQRVYASADRPVDLLAEVRTGDVVLVPHGWHGPSMAAPGYDLYYLNVMAGPGPREWLATDDPAHAWVRSTWPGQPVDPRLVDGFGWQRPRVAWESLATGTRPEQARLGEW